MKRSKLNVVEKEQLNHNVIRIVLESPHKLPTMPVHAHLYIYNDKGEYKPYSPLRACEKKIELAVKVYEYGNISRFIGKLNIGDNVVVSEYISKLQYKINEHKNVLMLAGGTGITPIYQTLNYALQHKDNMARFQLLFFNSTRNDIFLERELKELSELKGLNCLNIRLITTDALEISDELLVRAEIKHSIIKNVYDYVYVSGPPGFCQTVSGEKTKDLEQGELTGVLKEIGIIENKVWKF